MTRKSWITLVLLLTFFFSLSISSSQAQMKPKVTLTEDWILYGAQLPEFLAAAKGYYAAEGLEVNIVRGFPLPLPGFKFHALFLLSKGCKDRIQQKTRRDSAAWKRNSIRPQR